MDETEEGKTYQSRVENLDAITNNKDWHKSVVTNTSNEEFHDYTN
jgi:hypothetical protein